VLLLVVRAVEVRNLLLWWWHHQLVMILGSIKGLVRKGMAVGNMAIKQALLRLELAV